VHDLDHALAERARLQHGVFTLTQARAVGFTRSMIRARQGRGNWTDFMPGVLIISGAPVSWHTSLMGACLSTGGVASHRAAAVLHRVRGFPTAPVELTVRRPHHLGERDAIVHRSKDLHRIEPVLVDGIPTTPVSRLLVDLGAVVSFPRYEAAVDDLLGRRLLTWDDAVVVLAAHSRQGRNGCGPLRALLLERYGEHLPESVLEQAFLRVLRERGLAEPTGQHEIHDHLGFVARVDFAYPDRGIAIELDSVRFHLDRETFEKDHDKRARLAALGWTVLASTWQMVVEHPGRVATTVQRVYAEAAA
jgi:very-short-patch-repair endonuclease